MSQATILQSQAITPQTQISSQQIYERLEPSVVDYIYRYTDFLVQIPKRLFTIAEAEFNDKQETKVRTITKIGKDVIEIKYIDENCIEHRTDGPAKLEFYTDGRLISMMYYTHGILDNKNGPALFEIDWRDKTMFIEFYENGSEDVTQRNGGYAMPSRVNYDFEHDGIDAIHYLRSVHMRKYQTIYDQDTTFEKTNDGFILPITFSIYKDKTISYVDFKGHHLPCPEFKKENVIYRCLEYSNFKLNRDRVTYTTPNGVIQKITHYNPRTGKIIFIETSIHGRQNVTNNGNFRGQIIKKIIDNGKYQTHFTYGKGWNIFSTTIVNKTDIK